MTLGEKTKLARNKKKMSLQELSEKAGTHQKNISKYEKNLFTPSAINLKAIADTLDVTTDYLLGNEENTIKDIALLKQFKEVHNMPKDAKEALMQVISAYIRDYRTRQAYKS